MKEQVLTRAQKSALKKIEERKLLNVWFSAYDAKISRNVLDALVKKGFLRRRGENDLGSSFSPSTTIQYRVELVQYIEI